ncbi:MAG: ABC transporter permease [candidate division Zixibacteria bacterium]|nr:ABC transporter permease [candidate division Zixibacteria bacterium]
MSSELKTNLKAIWGRAYVRVVGANREPTWILSETLLPVLAVAAYVYVYRALNPDPLYTSMVILGGAMTAYWMNILWSMAMQLYWEKEMGNLDLYMVAPISRMSILLGMASGGLFFATLRALMVFAAGIILFQAEFVMVSFWKLFLIFFLSMFALYGLGMLFSSLFLLFGRGAWQTSNLFQEPIYLLGGFYYPVKSLGAAVAAIGSFLPITLGLDGIRQLTLKTGDTLGFLSVNLEIAILAVMSVIFLLGAYYSLLFMEKMGKKEGRLSLRWQ